MIKSITAILIIGLELAIIPVSAFGQAFGLREITDQSKECITCHKKASPAL